ncbi:hypothetical protein H4219_000472 [Mycoemilia scoparia]|uniref:HpcH/HpaI aldolase/citrate lyase domain-containing protein n=1 Tax=Mycoemilia scoparia TaxID=417184 RepID=A0A9W8A955_9FUNG|nr:hypothetical protein H4219_000472 [Mycoemilia scoparia]
MLYVPSSDESKIKKSLGIEVDSIIYDLEDGVPVNRKGQARELVTNALNLNQTPKVELAVRMNALGSGFEMDDLNVILQSKKLNTVIVPKVEHPNTVSFVSRMIDNVASSENRNKIGIVACIESAKGLINIKDIAAADKRVNALLVCIDIHDKNILTEESREGAEMGFTGKQVIHPGQIDIVQKVFVPSDVIMLKAWRIVQGYKQSMAAGKGAFDLEGQVIDLPLVKWAERILEKARLAGIDVESKYAKKY